MRAYALKLAALLALVVLIHAAALHWLVNHWRAVELHPMQSSMFTRVLEPVAELPARKAAKKPPQRPAPPPPASALSVSASASTTTTALEAPPQPTASTPAEATVAQAVPQPEPPLAVTSTASVTAGVSGLTSTAATTATGPLSTWPPDTRLSYRLTGFYRGDVMGSGRVQWQRQDDRYQVEVQLDLGVASFSMTSQGKVFAEHLQPEIYVESLLGQRRPITFGDTVMTMANGDRRDKPPLIQDTASQYIELSRYFANTPDALLPGSVVRVTMARPGGVDDWYYVVSGPETLSLVVNGRDRRVQAYKLSPKPLPNRSGYIFQETWYAPALAYLPVRIRVDLGDHNGNVELNVEAVEQK